MIKKYDPSKPSATGKTVFKPEVFGVPARKCKTCVNYKNDHADCDGCGYGNGYKNWKQKQ